MDNNYYMVEVLSKNEQYWIRLFLNDKKEIIEYYKRILILDIVYALFF